jgi:uncharacterized Zn finger protein
VTWGDRWRDRLVAIAGTRRADVGERRFRSGRVTDVRVRPGGVSGRVQGSRATPFLVELAVPTLGDDQWGIVVGLLAAQLRHGARLLAGLAPEGLEAELDAAGVALFRTSVETSCGCGAPVQPCEHAAGVWAAAGHLIDDDPFVLLTLRGRGRARVLADLAAARRSREAVVEAGMPIEGLPVAGWARAREPLGDFGVPPLRLVSPERMPLRLLGDPPGWTGGVDAWALFRPLVERAAAYAHNALSS